jgi:hypothetical protein
VKLLRSSKIDWRACASGATAQPEASAGSDLLRFAPVFRSLPLSSPEIFSPDGPLAQAIGGYRVRQQQVEMAERIAAAIHSNSVFIAEAGTGTARPLPTWCRRCSRTAR